MFRGRESCSRSLSGPSVFLHLQRRVKSRERKYRLVASAARGVWNRGVYDVPAPRKDTSRALNNISRVNLCSQQTSHLIQLCINRRNSEEDVRGRGVRHRGVHLMTSDNRNTLS